jgi:hypothetical protein
MTWKFTAKCATIKSMADNAPYDGDVEQAEDSQLHPDIRSYVTTKSPF